MHVEVVAIAVVELGDMLYRPKLEPLEEIDSSLALLCLDLWDCCLLNSRRSSSCRHKAQLGIEVLSRSDSTG